MRARRKPRTLRHGRRRLGERRWAVALALSLVCATGAWAGWEEGQAAYAAGQYAQAVLEFRAVLAEHPQYAPGHYMVGLCLYNLKQLDESLTSFSTAVRLETDNPHFRLALGRALIDGDRYQDAYDALRPLDYGALPENLKRAFVQLQATAAARVGKAGEAVAALEAAVNDGPGDAGLWFALGQARAAAADDVGAFEAFVKVCELDPTHTSASRRAAETAMGIGDSLAEASDRGSWYRWGAEYADKAVALEPTLENQLLAGEAWSGAGEPAKAEQWLAQAVTTAPESALARYQLGRLLSAQDRDAEAVPILRRALELTDDPGLRRNLLRAIAFALRKQQQFAEAGAVYAELGDAARVAEMERLAAIAQQNLESDAGVRDCLSRWEGLQELMERNRHLEGTAAWDAIAAEERLIRAECGEVLGL